MATTAERLERLKYYATRYELAAINGDTRILLVYSYGRGRRAILESARKHGEKLVALTGRQSIDFAKRASDGATMGDWQIRFTGRTQRDAICSGELPWIGDIRAEATQCA